MTTETSAAGTGADGGAPGQDTGSAWDTRSADCPEDPAQARRATCHEGVTRAGNYEPCDKPAVATSVDPEWLQAYPVCRAHRLPAATRVDPWGLAQSA